MSHSNQKLLLAAERFDAVAHFHRAQTQEHSLEQAWRDLLTAQSHDVSLCEYSRWWGPMAARDRIEDKHNLAWGVIGYNHMDAAQGRGQTVLNSALNYLSSQIDSESRKQGPLAVTVFNPSGWERSGIVTTGRIHFKEQRGRNLVVKDKRGLETVRGVSFSVREGEILGIAGVQGNGQTELVEALTGLTSAQSGRWSN